jgi:aldose 1-epimerase
VPFSGRISGGGFFIGDQFHAIAPNLSGEKPPIHGSGFNAPWRVTGQCDSEIVLSLPNSTIGPFRFDAEVCYRLDGSALHMEMSVTNRAGMPLPYWYRLSSLVRARYRYAADRQGENRMA